MVPGFLQTLGIQAKEFNLSFIRPENLVSWCESLLGAFGKLIAGRRVPFTEEWLQSGHSTITA